MSSIEIPSNTPATFANASVGFFSTSKQILLQLDNLKHITLEVITAVTMKNVVWDVAPCKSCVNLLQSPAHAGSSLADFSTLKIEAIYSPETSVHTKSTRLHINLKYFSITFFQNPSNSSTFRHLIVR
jgi:hypothetical protein